jgi:hypothetical protein
MAPGQFANQTDFLRDAQAVRKKGTSLDEFVKTCRVPDKHKNFNADAGSVRANAEAIFAGKSGRRRDDAARPLSLDTPQPASLNHSRN